MGMIFDKDDGDKMIDGVVGGFVAVQRTDAAGRPARIEIWRDDYECHCGNLPAANWSALQINGAISMFIHGELKGSERGKADAQFAMKKALGLAGQRLNSPACAAFRAGPVE